MTIRTIVAAIALENGDEPVARRAIQLAAAHGASLVLVHAIESLPASDPDLPSPAKEEAIAKVLAAEATASLQHLAEGAVVQTELSVECGRADQIIDRLIRDHAADLLIIGPGKPQNLRERVFGSTADRVVRNCACPILVVKREAVQPYRRIAAAIDFSPMSFTAAQIAARIAPLAAFELIHTLEISADLRAGNAQGGHHSGRDRPVSQGQGPDRPRGIAFPTLQPFGAGKNPGRSR